MRPGKATGHGDAWDVSIFGKKLREQQPWEAGKISFTIGFRVLQLPKKLFKK
jgi:hypothetical protein